MRFATFVAVLASFTGCAVSGAVEHATGTTSSGNGASVGGSATGNAGASTGASSARGSASAGAQGSGASSSGSGGSTGRSSSTGTASGTTGTASGSSSSGGTTGLPPNGFQKRYVLYFGNLEESATVADLDGLMSRAADAGYNGFVLGDYGAQYQKLQNESAQYTANFQTVAAQAQTLGLTLIPYGLAEGDAVYWDRTTAEAVPVQGTPFVVSGSTASVQNAPNVVADPGFEASSSSAWSTDSVCSVDTTVSHSGSASMRCDNPGLDDAYGHARMYQTVNVTAFRAYQFSFWAKTSAINFGLTTDILGANGAEQNLGGGLGNGASQATQGWTQYTINLMSFHNTQVSIYLGAWAPGGTGSFWIDDVSVTEVGLANTLERPGSPVTVTSQSGTTTYAEGTDFTVGDQQLTLPQGSAIRDGEALAVSWYQLADYFGDFNSYCQANTWTLNTQFATGMDALFANGGPHPPGMMFDFDEWRVMGWDPSCPAGQTAGQYLAATTAQMETLLWGIGPSYELYTWSDMYEPNENQNPQYYLSNGTLAGSQAGLDPRTVIMQWIEGSGSLQYFSGLGLRGIIAGYYDSVDNVNAWLTDLDTAEAQGTLGVVGFMYTTWDANYSDLENVANAIKTHVPNRWQSGPAF